MTTFYTYNPSTRQLSVAPSVVTMPDGTQIANPTAAQYAAVGAYPLKDTTPPTPPTGMVVVTVDYELDTSVWMWVPQYDFAEGPVPDYATSAEWADRSSYVPAVGKIVVWTDHGYVVPSGSSASVPVPGIKVGDGSTRNVDLPFLGDDEVARIMELIGGKADKSATYTKSEVDDLVASATQNDYNAMSLTWAELKAKRDGSTLVPGAFYRITDYVATTSGDMSSRSANHPFDLIVVADAADRLNETARVALHAGDTYFAASVLQAWRVQYCLDNDTARFAWADATNGKGVVYNMEDEFGNECPYDFKGIQFLAYGDSDNVYRYTFDSGDASGNTDYSLAGFANGVYDNRIMAYVASSKRKLNCIVFKGAAHTNLFENNCYFNTLGSGSNRNAFGGDCYNNIAGGSFSTNVIGRSSNNNTFGISCHNNSLGYNCDYNTIGDHFRNNELGDYCISNTFGNHCESNTLGDYCDFITVGGDFNDNNIGCFCNNISFKNGNATKHYVDYVTIEGGNQYITLNLAGTSSATSPYRNVTVKAGVNNTTTTKTITDATNGGQLYNTVFRPANSKEISV